MAQVFKDWKSKLKEVHLNLLEQYHRAVDHVEHHITAARKFEEHTGCLHHDPSSNHLVIKIVSVQNVPKTDTVYHSDPFIKVYFHHPVKGLPVSTLHRTNCKNAIWNSYRCLGVSPEPTDVLQVELWDSNILMKDHIVGYTEVAVCQLSSEPRSFVLDIPESPRSRRNSCSVTLALGSQPLYSKKLLFFVRHGQSGWNLAQKNRQLHKLLKFDHCLSKTGIEQAQNLASSVCHCQESDSPQGPIESCIKSSPEYYFTQADAIFSSPLIRAFQTSLVALNAHPQIKNSGITLLSSLREIKQLGGLDTVSITLGTQIPVRAKSKFIASGMLESDVDRLMSVPIHVNDTTSSWCTPTEEYDSPFDVSGRFLEFWSCMLFLPFRSGIVVGHSHFLRELCKRHLSESLKENDPELCSNLSSSILENCGCVALYVDFGHAEPQIIDAITLFGSKFDV